MGLNLRISNYILTKVFIIMSFWQFFINHAANHKIGCYSPQKTYIVMYEYVK